MKTIYHLFMGKRFEFYSPYSISEIHERLEPMADQNPSFVHIEQKSLKLQIHEKSEKVFRFSGGKSLVAMVHVIAHQEPSGVHVTGRVTIQPFMVFLMMIWLSLTLLTILVGIASPIDTNNRIMSIMPVLMTCCTLFFLAQSIYAQHNLHKMIQNKLGKSKRKKTL